MKFGFVAKHRSIWPLAWLCEALGVSRLKSRERPPRQKLLRLARSHSPSLFSARAWLQSRNLWALAPSGSAASWSDANPENAAASALRPRSA
jgi:putative transposase